MNPSAVLRYHLIMALTFHFLTGYALAQSQPDSSEPKAELARKIAGSMIIVVGEFKSTENDRRAKAPIKVVEVLKGQPNDNVELVACFQATAVTVSPPRNSRWIFFLLSPTETTKHQEFRKVFGENYDYDGILPATDANIRTVKSKIVELSIKPKQ